MKFRDIGLVTGLAVGGAVMAMGLIIMSFGDLEPGGNGLMLFVGGLVFVPGLVIAIASFAGWLSSSFYNSLGPKYKRYLGRGLLILLVGFVSVKLIDIYGRLQAGGGELITLYEEPSAEDVIFEKRRAAARKLLVGQWERLDDPNYIIVFGEQGDVVSNDHGNLFTEAIWSLSVYPYHVADKTFAFDVIIEKQDQSWWLIVRHLDSEKLVIHSNDDESGTLYRRSSEKNEQVELQ